MIKKKNLLSWLHLAISGALPPNPRAPKRAGRGSKFMGLRPKPHFLLALPKRKRKG